MCVVSNVGDYARTSLPNHFPWMGIDSKVWPCPSASPSQAEFDALKKEVVELKKLLRAAKKFDEATGQHDCEAPDKVAFLKSVADFVGVDLSKVLS